MSTPNGTGNSPDPIELREEVEQELHDLAEEAAGEEVERMAERDRGRVDENSDDRDQTLS